MFNGLRYAAVIILAVTTSACVTAQKKMEFNWQSDDRRVVLLPTDIQLSEMTAGGVEVPNADWTAKAEKHFLTSLETKLSELNAEVVESEQGINQPEEQVKLLKLHGVVGGTMLLFSSLPTKQGDNAKWSLGPAATTLRDRYDADYALFVYVRDSYTSPGRVAAIIIGAAFGVGMRGGTQVGYATLVDLNTGDVVWNNFLVRGKGDMRTLEGAAETADAILKGFPKEQS